MVATLAVADQLDEVIIFRSTGPWSWRWIERRYPTKNFHVKGKSSDWGPQAGFVPREGVYSKVGGDATKAKDSSDANAHGIKDGYAATTQLSLTLEELQMQWTDPEEVPARLAVYKAELVQGSKDYIMFARRSGDNKEFVFRAVWNGAAAYAIFVYPERLGVDPKRLLFEKPIPLQVMTSSEVGPAISR